MIAYHYPPAFGSSGLQRTLKFSRYLSESGWHPMVLSVADGAHARLSDGQLDEIPSTVPVTRAFALDSARHLSILGRYPQFLALPDRWVSWLLGAVPAGLALIRRHRPQVLWSTYPIATAHLVGLVLHRLTRLPWVADFRDSMTEDDYPPDRRTRRVFRWIERKTVHAASRVVFTTPGTLAMYAERYPNLPSTRWAIIPNGYDEANFVNLEAVHRSRGGGRLNLLHSGILYPEERDPREFFAALAELAARGDLEPEQLTIMLRASGHDAVLSRMIADAGVQRFVTLKPGVPYGEALAEMMSADGLLLFQARNCNHQIPAKVYEYLRTGRPILALTDPEGDTAKTLRDCGLESIVRLDDRCDIGQGLMAFVDQIRNDDSPAVSREVAAQFSRRSQTEQLATLLDQVSQTTDAT